MSKSWVYLEPGEQIVLEIRAHWVGLTGVALRLVVLTVVTGYALGHAATWFGSPDWVTLGFRIAVFIVFLLLLRATVIRQFRRWANFRATVTDRRLLVRFDRRCRIGWDLPLLGVSEIHAHRGLLQRAVGAGSIVITSPMTNGPAVLPNVARVEDHQAALLQLRATAWAQYQQAMAYPAAS